MLLKENSHISTFYRKEMEKSKKKQMKFNFGYFILISKTFHAKDQSSKEPAQIFYTNSEEELLEEVLDVYFISERGRMSGEQMS